LAETNKHNMQNGQLNDREFDVAQIAAKIKFLQDLLYSLQNEQNLRCSIEITYDSGVACFVEQDLIPFNLPMEVKMLLAASIDHYQRLISNVHE